MKFLILAIRPAKLLRVSRLRDRFWEPSTGFSQDSPGEGWESFTQQKI